MREEKNFFGYVKSVNREDRTLDIIASTNDIDRDGEIILPSAFAEKIDSFKKNACVLSCHQHRLASGESPVIGSAIPQTIQITAKDLRFKIRFADTPLGENYWSLYRDGHMKAFSCGFISLKGENREIKGKTVFVHTLVELLEVSAVPVPSNRAALARAKRLGWLENKKQEREDIPLATEKECEDFAEALLGAGKYADPRVYKDFAHPPQGAMDEDGDSEFSDDALPDCSALVSGR